ncbi:MAG: ABC transporter permease subunit [Nitrososphaerota archaeon]|nr:ABC transporter permease subunit [Nitrososphaerota archaeon]MDG6974717.1 ABC transporter permease subunit [Nitrososphaerota archaeon]MDG7009980.1 ABC transporter permease subunit [Nitrososphaerota archaeon]MDG7019019.1 ABC transporter permease subunit [Nitrososphaerota archaeon]
MSVSLSAPSSNLSSYVSLFAQTDFGRVVYNTVFFAVGTAVVSVLVGAAFAILVDSRRRAKRAISLIAYLPYMIPFTASALIWATLFNPGYGPLDPILTSLGLPAINWLGPALQLYSLTMVGVWTSIPLAFLIILAGLSSVPKQVKEAASVDGMEMWDYYSSVALPLAKGAVITAFLMVMILGFGNFDLPYILSGAGGVPPVTMATMVVYAYAEMFYANLAPQGLAAAIFVALLASIPGLLLVRTTLGASKDGRGRTWLPRLRVPRVHLPGSRRAFNAPFRYILYLVCSLVSVFILFPVYWMGLIAFRPQSLDYLLPPIIYPTKIITGVFLQTVAQASPEIITTFFVSCAVTAVTILLAAPAAYIIARERKRALLGIMIYVFSLPSIVFVYGIFSMMVGLRMLNTWTALILTEPLFTVPFVVWTMTNFYSSLPRQYEEAALVDGYSRIRSFISIVMPLARPGLIAAGMVAFIFSWHLLLFPLVLSQTPFSFTFPPVGSNTVTTFAILFDPDSTGGTISNNVWTQLASSGIILAIPVIILSIVAQGYLLKGLYSGGVKG